MGVLRTRDRGAIYLEKKEGTYFKLTPSGKEGIAKKSQVLKISQAELLEQFSRSVMKIEYDPNTKQYYAVSYWVFHSPKLLKLLKEGTENNGHDS